MKKSKNNNIILDFSFKFYIFGFIWISLNCTALSDASLFQSHLQEKKIWAVQFTNCTAQGGRAVHAPPFQVQFSDIPLVLYTTVLYRTILRVYKLEYIVYTNNHSKIQHILKNKRKVSFLPRHKFDKKPKQR